MTSLLGLGLLTACTNDELSENFATNQNEGGAKVQIALTIANTSAATRAVSGNTGDEEYGDDNEYTVNDLLVVFANANGIAQNVYDTEVTMKADNFVTGQTNDLIRVTEPFEVEPMDAAYVYVIANYKSSKSALTPIIQGQTDMKTVFNISNAAALSTPGNFLMSNAEQPKSQAIYATNSTEAGTNYTTEKDDAGSDEANAPEKVQLLDISIQRVVAKVTFEQETTTGIQVKNAASNVIATAALTGAELINLNKKMYMVMDETKATNKPTSITGNWAYPKDPNYEGQSITNVTWLGENFSNPTASFSDWDGDSPTKTFDKAIFYCPENTMDDAEQKNGVTTGVVYRVKWTVNTTETTGYENGYTKLSSEATATDYLSQRYQAVLADDNCPSTVTKDIFTTAESGNTNGTFYTYADYIFISKAAACLYKAAVNNTDASAIISAYNSLIAKSFGAQTNSLEEEGIYQYENGVCYYPVWIMHNPDATVAMQQDKYGVVRNHWYVLTVQSISELGNYKPTYDDPDDPDDPEKAKIQVQAKIKKWTLVKQNVNL